MVTELSKIERHLASTNKQVRLRALKLLLTHPDATSLQIVQGLCSPDSRNGEFLNLFELHEAIRRAWTRIDGVTDSSVYGYLADLYAADPDSNVDSVLGVLMHLGTRKALALAKQMRLTLPERSRVSFPFVLETIAARAVAR
jgi:hypothetical protein